MKRIALAEGIDTSLTDAVVVVGRDTRPSSPAAVTLVTRGAHAAGARIDDVGIVTTPQLHHCVRMLNATPARRARYGGLSGYNTMLREAYSGVLGATTEHSNFTATRGPLLIDCAHGVGFVAASVLAPLFEPVLMMELRNTGATLDEALLLNDGVGAEHVQKGRLPPAGFSPVADLGARCASLDGDADRIVYWHWRKADSAWRLQDGDKIAALAASFLAEQLADAGFAVSGEPSGHGHEQHSKGPRGVGWDESNAWQGASGEALDSLRAAPISVGIVQTAYANGASGDFIRESLKLPTRIAKTGVKFVHAVAADFDIGVYFEANGHGTVLFAPALAARLESAVLGHSAEELEVAAGSKKAALALSRLFWASRLINQAVGDALSDGLFVEAILTLKGWGVGEWDALYEDLPSRQAKLAVPDRAAFIPIPDETRLTAPVAVQAALDALTCAAPRGRAFVRPSGTEDVVRVYAEASTQEIADKLCADILGCLAKN